jgi:hypothetical protein
MTDESTADRPSALSRDRLELVQVVILAIAALLTAWAAFQSTKWGGVQANSFSQAAAQRTESIRAANLANRQTVIDVDSFTSWVASVAAEQRAGIDNGLDTSDGTYSPVDGTESAFLYARLRPEFRTAFDSWLATRPLADSGTATTPFDQPEYTNAAQVEADELEARAEDLAHTARRANQRGDNYVMMTIVFALAIVLTSIAAKLSDRRLVIALTALAGVAVAAGIFTLLTYPIEV